MKTLIVFDFDQTLVDDNCDMWVNKCAPGQSLPPGLENSYQSGRWTDYMGRVMSYLGDNGVRQEAMRIVMETMPFTGGMLELLKFIMGHKSHLDCVVISDANSVFIEWILQAAGLRAAVNQIFTNPASFDQRGYLSVEHHHAHQCPQCPVNMCKRKVLQDYVVRQSEAGVCYRRICYVGDGRNDLCPVTILGENDLVMPRMGFTLERLLKKAQNAGQPLNPQIFPWSSGLQILDKLHELIEP